MSKQLSVYWQSTTRLIITNIWKCFEVKIAIWEYLQVSQKLYYSFIQKIFAEKLLNVRWFSRCLECNNEPKRHCSHEDYILVCGDRQEMVIKLERERERFSLTTIKGKGS
jgi:hypothetical protein